MERKYSMICTYEVPMSYHVTFSGLERYESIVIWTPGTRDRAFLLFGAAALRIPLRWSPRDGCECYYCSYYFCYCYCQEWEIDQLLQLCRAEIHYLGFCNGFESKRLHQNLSLLEGPIMQ